MEPEHLDGVGLGISQRLLGLLNQRDISSDLYRVTLTCSCNLHVIFHSPGTLPGGVVSL